MPKTPYTHPNAVRQYDTPESYVTRKAAEQQKAIADTAPARKADQANQMQRGHNLAQAISDDVSLQAGPIGQAQVAHARQRLENDRYNALTPEQRSAEYGAKMQKMQDIAKDPLSHGAQPVSVLTEVDMHKQDIDEKRKALLSDPTFKAQTGLDTSAIADPNSLTK